VGPPPLEEAAPGGGVEDAAERDLHVEGAVVAAAGLRLDRRRFALVAQGCPLTADGAGQRADEPGLGVLNRANGSRPAQAG
jgi:hypothetical protein